MDLKFCSCFMSVDLALLPVGMGSAPTSVHRAAALLQPLSSDRKDLFDLRALDWDGRTVVDHPPDGARLFNSADLEDALPVPSADETYAFSFTGTAANSKTEFSIKMQDAAAGAVPCLVHSTGVPSEQNKCK